MNRMIKHIIAFGLLFSAGTAYAAVLGFTGMDNWFTSTSDLTIFLLNVLAWVVRIGIPAVFLGLIWSGFLFAAAQGNPQKLADARKNFFFVVIGVGIVLGAWTLGTIVVNTVDFIVGP